jgi:hypothetical protein
MAEGVAGADGVVHVFELQAIKAIRRALDLPPGFRSIVT